MSKTTISASILSANFAHLGEDVRAVLHAGADAIHFDVMDHHFVPNLSFGAVVCKALRNDGVTAPIDVHLMVEHPEQYFEPFAKAGADLITFHPETVDDVSEALTQCRELGLKAGLAFNPDRALDITDDILARLDMVLLMSVFPGFGGQSFIPESLEKVRATRERLTAVNSQAALGIDGGIKVNNIGDVVHAGADFIIVGSGLFGAQDYSLRMQELRAQI